MRYEKLFPSPCRQMIFDGMEEDTFPSPDGV